MLPLLHERCSRSPPQWAFGPHRIPRVTQEFRHANRRNSNAALLRVKQTTCQCGSAENLALNEAASPRAHQKNADHAETRTRKRVTNQTGAFLLHRSVTRSLSCAAQICDHGAPSEKNAASDRRSETCSARFLRNEIESSLIAVVHDMLVNDLTATVHRAT